MAASAEVLSTDIDRFNIEERAAAYFIDLKTEVERKIEKREASLAEARRHDKKDPNIPSDLDFIELHKAILRGINDAIMGSSKRSDVERSKLKKDEKSS